MKTAGTIPDDVFEEAERLVDRLQTSRSQLYARALAEFVARHADDRVEAAMNAVVAEVGPTVDEFTREAARKTLRRVEWQMGECPGKCPPEGRSDRFTQGLGCL